MTTFAVGEVAIVHGLVNWPECNGQEVEIISPLSYELRYERRAEEYRAVSAHKVRYQDGVTSFVMPQNLRKRRPPSTDESESRQAMLDCIERARRGVEVPA